MTVHYHGTPITPTRILMELAGANFCVSYARPDQVRLCHEIGQSVMLDNGAFSVWKRGYVPDWKKYYGFCEEWLAYPTTWAVIPDAIVGDDADNDALIKEWPFPDDLGAPVWHMHESTDRLRGLVDRFPRVCIGSSGQFAELMAPAWQRRMDEAWRSLKAAHTPNIHMLRGMQLVRERWPFASVDSTDIARNHSRYSNTATKMRQRWDAGQCPPRFNCPGEQLEIAV